MKMKISHLSLFFLAALTAVILFSPLQVLAHNFSWQNTSQKFHLKTALSELSEIDRLQNEIDTAKKSGDDRSVVNGYLKLAEIYKEGQDYENAIAANEQGLWLAETLRDSESLFRLLRQYGDINLILGEKDRAFLGYQQALWNLRVDRSHPSINNNVLLYEIAGEAEDFLREYISLLVSDSSNSDRLTKAIEALSVLKVTEFQAYFQEPCIDVNIESSQTEVESDEDIARVYSFITPKRTYLIYKLGRVNFEIKSLEITEAELTKKVQNYRTNLLNIYDRPAVNQSGEELGRLLIEPLDRELKRNKIERINFIHDGALKLIPMESLILNDRYLIEDYIISYGSGLKSTRSRSENNNRVPVLLAGASEFQLPYTPIPQVVDEIESLSNLIEQSSVLKNKDFTVANLFESISDKQYSIVHVATHGFFKGNAENSYLVAYDDTISIAELTNIFLTSITPIDLIVLTACQTAEGNNASPLGISGTAIRGGAGSIIASLWSIKDDRITSTIETFYRRIESGKSIATAKTEAQLSQINQHPGYWASLIFYDLSP